VEQKWISVILNIFKIIKEGEIIMSKIRCLQMDLDEFWSNNESIYTEYDIGSFRRKVVIKPEDREKFLDKYALEFRLRAEKCLEKVLHDEDDLYLDKD